MAKKLSKRKYSKATEHFITGTVTSVNVKGLGRNSAQLLFTVLNKKTAEHQAIMVTAFPGHEPQVFASMASFVTTAHFSHKQITAGYITNPGETNRAVEVFSPVRRPSAKTK